MMTKSKQKQLEVYRLENATIAIEVVPDRGGKTISIYHKPAQFELLYQRPDFGQREVQIYSAFGQGDASGFDDAFPGIDEEMVMVGGRQIRYPDHGEVWSSRMRIIEMEPDSEQPSITLTMDSMILPYSYKKKISLTGNSQVTYSYNLRNAGNNPIPCLWACHCLVRYEEEMRLIYPQGVNVLENVMASPELGEAGKCYSYPGTSSYDYRRVPEREPATMLKYYVKGQIASGKCGYYYPLQKMQCLFHYDAEKLPYLGFWLTAGGYQEDYNCAFEPANGYYDNVTTAAKNNACYVLEPGEELAFQLDIEILKTESENCVLNTKKN